METLNKENAFSLMTFLKCYCLSLLCWIASEMELLFLVCKADFYKYSFVFLCSVTQGLFPWKLVNYLWKYPYFIILQYSFTAQIQHICIIPVTASSIKNHPQKVLARVRQQWQFFKALSELPLKRRRHLTHVELHNLSQRNSDTWKLRVRASNW